MKTPDFTKIPTVIFAHRLTVASHHAVLEYPGDALEISAVVEGYLDVETADGYCDRANVGDVIANFHKAPLKVNTDKCVGCKSCMRIGCPAISIKNGKACVDNTLCVGCGVCSQLCKFDALESTDKEACK